MKIRPGGAKVFNSDGQTDRNDDANNRFLKFCECPYYAIIGLGVMKLNTVCVVTVHPQIRSCV
jgi:hypothetical protein